MKKLKMTLATMSILFALSGTLTPVQVALADGGQGTSDSQRRSTSQAEKSAALWALIMRLLGW